jgi:hypothetical protein
MWIRACFAAEGKGKGWIVFNNSERHAVADPSLASAEPLNPAALTPAEAAWGLGFSVETVRADIAARAPTNVARTVNLVRCATW